MGYYFVPIFVVGQSATNDYVVVGYYFAPIFVVGQLLSDHKHKDTPGAGKCPIVNKPYAPKEQTLRF